MPEPVRDELGNIVPPTDPPKEDPKAEQPKDVDLPIPVSNGGESTGGDSPVLVTVNKDGTTSATGDPAVSFADIPGNVHQQGLARISGAGAMAHENFVQFSHILDLGFESDRHVVSLQQALGVREVTSQSGQLGIPNAVTGKPA